MRTPSRRLLVGSPRRVHRRALQLMREVPEAWSRFRDDLELQNVRLGLGGGTLRTMLPGIVSGVSVWYLLRRERHDESRALVEQLRRPLGVERVGADCDDWNLLVLGGILRVRYPGVRLGAVFMPDYERPRHVALYVADLPAVCDLQNGQQPIAYVLPLARQVLLWDAVVR